MAEKNDDRRKFEFVHDDGTEENFYIGMPSSDHIRKADWHYSKVYNEAISTGFATESEMLDKLKDKGVLGKDYEDKKVQLQTELVKALTLMEVEEDPMKKGKLAIEAKLARDELFRWNQRASGPLSNTCERIANDSKTEFLTSAMIQKEDGSLVWEDYDSFLEEKNQRLVIKSRYEVILILEGLEQDFLEKTPEDQVLRKLADEADKKEDEKLDAKMLETSEEEKPEKKQPKKRAARKTKAG